MALTLNSLFHSAHKLLTKHFHRLPNNKKKSTTFLHAFCPSQTKCMQGCYCQRNIGISSHSLLAAETPVSRKQCWLTRKKCMLTKTDNSTSRLSRVERRRVVAPKRQEPIFSFHLDAFSWFLPHCESYQYETIINTPVISILEPNKSVFWAFHKSFVCVCPSFSKRTVMSVSGLREEVLSLCHTWRGCCGVLLFLYSVILTKVKRRNRARI